MHVSRVKSISCNMCNSGYVPLSLSPQLLPPLFLLSLCPGSALPLKARLQLPCCAPLSPGRRRPCPQEGSPHSPPLLAGCCAGMAGHTLRNKVLSSQSLQRRALELQSRCRPQASRQLPGQRKTRASPSRENAIISRYFVFPASNLGGARFGSENPPERR